MPPYWSEWLTMQKPNFSIADFVLTSDFRDWILAPSKRMSLRWEVYLEKYPEDVNEIQLARELALSLSNIDYKIKEKDLSNLWSQREDKLDQLVEKAQETTQAPSNSEGISRRPIENASKRKSNFWLLKSAAILVFGILLGFLPYSVLEKEIPQQTNWRKSTKTGIKSSMPLSDGSEVKRNAGTTIRSVQNFNGNTREIFLDCERFFEIAPDALLPFIGYIQGITTKALDTSFYFKASTNENIAISLITGKEEVKS